MWCGGRPFARFFHHKAIYFPSARFTFLACLSVGSSHGRGPSSTFSEVLPLGLSLCLLYPSPCFSSFYCDCLLCLSEKCVFFLACCDIRSCFLFLFCFLFLSVSRELPFFILSTFFEPDFHRSSQENESASMLGRDTVRVQSWPCLFLAFSSLCLHSLLQGTRP